MRAITTGAASLAAVALTITTMAMSPSTATTATTATTAPLAGSIGVKDAKDLDHGVDLRSVVLDHRADKVVVTTTHTNLRPSFRTGSSGSVFLDTDEANPGPEYVFVGGYYAGTDYQLLHTDGFHHSTWGKAVKGTYDLRIDYDKDRVRMRMSREAIGSPEQVRVAVKVGGTRTDGTSKGLVDWLGAPRSFTEWVAQ